MLASYLKTTGIVCALLAAGAVAAAEGSAAAPLLDERRHAEVDARIASSRLVEEGFRLDAEGAAALEAGLEKQPDDLRARTLLLAYYSNGRSIDAQKAWRGHALEMIGRHPDAPVCATRLCSINRMKAPSAYDEGRKLWLEHIEKRPSDTTLITNAVRYFLRNDQQVAEELLMKARRLEPENPEWPRRLAGLYALLRRYGPPDGSEEAARRSFSSWKEAYGLMTDELGKLRLLPTVARAAFDAGALGEAQSYANRALEAVERLRASGSHGEAWFYGHLVLGRLALREGNLDAAKAHLLEAGKTPGSPKLSSVGPNMTLAMELVKSGERETVAEFLESCRKFWSRGAPKLDVWIETVRSGGTPAFGPNLVF